MAKRVDSPRRFVSKNWRFCQLAIAKKYFLGREMFAKGISKEFLRFLRREQWWSQRVRREENGPKKDMFDFCPSRTTLEVKQKSPPPLFLPFGSAWNWANMNSGLPPPREKKFSILRGTAFRFIHHEERGGKRARADNFSPSINVKFQLPPAWELKHSAGSKNCQWSF